MRTPPAARRHVASLLLTVGLIIHAGAHALSAQESQVAPGTRVRFELRSGTRLEGRAISLSRDTLETGGPTTGSTARFPLGDIARLQVVDGRHRPVRRGALIGAVAGAALGAAIGGLSYDESDADLIINNRESAAYFGAVLLGVSGLVVGGLQGLIPRDRWRTIPLDGRGARFNLRSLPAGGHGVGLALAF